MKMNKTCVTSHKVRSTDLLTNDDAYDDDNGYE